MFNAGDDPVSSMHRLHSMEELNDKPWHSLPGEEVVGFLGVNLATGLSADEVRSRQKEFGPNRVAARRGTPAWMKFLQQFNQPLVYILLIACTVTAFLGEWVDSSVIFGVVLINARMVKKVVLAAKSAKPHREVVMSALD
jgi:magnesium-transporting ATPase (P-type)